MKPSSKEMEKESKEIEYCTCEGNYPITGGFDDFDNEWDICTNCNKPIEDSYVQNPVHSDY